MYKPRTPRPNYDVEPSAARHPGTNVGAGRTLSLALFLTLSACSGADSADTNPTWTDASHGDVSPDYSQVFDASSVIEMSIVIAPEDYAAMQDDMTSLLGELGSSPDGGFSPPPGIFEACNGLAEDDPCTLELDGMSIAGTCTSQGEELACMPEGGVMPGGGGVMPGGGADIDDLLGGEPIYVPVTLHYDDKVWEHVAMRYKGNSSLSSSWTSGILKLPFRLHFDKFEDEFPAIEDQRFYGFKKLTFASGFGDTSFVRDALMADLLEDNDVPVARYRFVRINVDFGEGPVFYGLYTMIEDPSDAMMGRLYGDGDKGNIYKPSGVGADWTTFDEAGFAKKTNESEGDWSDVEAAVTALHADRSDADSWRAALEATFDADGFLRWLAVNTFVGNWDTYGGLAHNYYLFGHPDTGVLAWIPWDHNLSMQTGGGPGGGMGGGMGGGIGGIGVAMDLANVGDQWPLITFLRDDPVYSAAYFDNLKAVAASLASRDRYVGRLEELHALVAPHVADEVAPYTHLSDLQLFDDSVADLTEYIESRHATLESLSK